MLQRFSETASNLANAYQPVATGEITQPFGGVAPLGIGKGPVAQQAPRQPEKLESLIGLLCLVVGISSVVTPVGALIEYPQGIVLEPIMFLMKLYVLCFGITIILLECGNFRNRRLLDFQWGLRIGFGLITRIAGKGIFFMFVGCSCFNVLNFDVQSGFLQFGIIVVGLGCIGVGAFLLMCGVQKTLRLDKVRNAMKNHQFGGEPIFPRLQNPEESQLLETLKHQENFFRYISAFAEEHPKLALTKVEFNQLCQDVTKNRDHTFGDWDLEMIFNALNAEMPPVASDIPLDVGVPNCELLSFKSIFQWCAGPPALL